MQQHGHQSVSEEHAHGGHGPCRSAASSKIYSPQDIASERPAAPGRRASARRSFLPGLHWVEPKIVAEITYLTWTADNLLRHTVYVGLREDKPATDVRREGS